MGFILWGIFLFLGATGLRVKQGLLFSAITSAVLTAIGAAASQTDPLCGAYDCSVSAAGIAFNFAIKLSMCLLFYGIGKAGRAIWFRWKPESVEPTD